MSTKSKKIRLEPLLENSIADVSSDSDSSSNVAVSEKRKLKPANGDKDFSFQEFTVDRVLSVDPRSKYISVLGSFSDSQNQGIVVAEKQPLTEASLPNLFSLSASVDKKFQNDVYSQYVLDCKEGGLGEVRVTTIYPATEEHVKKYEAQKRRIILETPKDYQKFTKPFAEKQSLSLDWVYNILDNKSEVERVIYQDSDPEVGFVLVPDLKWDQKEEQDLYVLAIARKRGVLSMRELQSEHLPMLRNILVAGKKEISTKYGVGEDQLRAYLHYQPSCYHLHIHFTHIQFSAPKSTVGEAYLLDDVIDNIAAIDPLFYAKRTLSFVVKESSSLWKDHYATRKDIDSHSVSFLRK